MHGLMVFVCGGFLWMYPKEVVDMYGDFKDWENSCGTGPFCLTDYVVSTSISYEKNPSYWHRDKLHPDNQIPYIDGVKQLIIPDQSTQIAALRTGKIDTHEGVRWEDAELLTKQCPELKYIIRITPPSMPVGRMDKEELPFKDIMVRHALCLAVNQQEIVDDYYEGNATLFALPWPPTPTYSQIFTPLEEQSATVQELFTYNPQKAKQMLADAGYPDGFKTEIVCDMGSVDFLSMVREYFLAVGVDMEIKPLERGAFWGMNRARTHPEMIFKFTPDYMVPFRMLTVREESFDNPAYFEHPLTRECYEVVSAAAGIDDSIVNAELKKIGPFMLEQAWGIWMPAPHAYKMWWPWLQNYNGEGNMGYFDPNRWSQYIWLDEEMKSAMGY
jgi:peptide/nickel transport system substrate-binding protein